MINNKDATLFLCHYPKDLYSEVNPIQFNGADFQLSMHKITNLMMIALVESPSHWPHCSKCHK